LEDKKKNDKVKILGVSMKEYVIVVWYANKKMKKDIYGFKNADNEAIYFAKKHTNVQYVVLYKRVEKETIGLWQATYYYEKDIRVKAIKDSKKYPYRILSPDLFNIETSYIL
jgi:hypothetical protein